MPVLQGWPGDVPLDLRGVPRSEQWAVLWSAVHCVKACCMASLGSLFLHFGGLLQQRLQHGAHPCYTIGIAALTLPQCLWCASLASAA